MVASPQIMGWSSWGVVYGSRKTLFCTESRLESVILFVFFIRNREKFAKNVGVKGENVNILGEKTFFELTTKKKVVKIFGLENRRVFRKIGIFSAGIENFCDRIQDPHRLRTRL